MDRRFAKSYNFGMLHLKPLRDALSSLEDILKQPMNEYVRDGAIQRFEYTFELCWKSLQRVLKERGVETGSPTQVLRAAHKEQLIDDIDDWLAFLKARNLTVHTYNQNLAEEVFGEAKRFPARVRKLLKTVKDEESS